MAFKVKDLMINVLPCGVGCSLSCDGHPTCVGCSAVGAVPALLCTAACSGACSHPCTAVCTHACTAACTQACTFACTGACTQACTQACTYACTHPCTNACTGLCTFECTQCTCTFCSQGCTACTGITCHPISILPQAGVGAPESSLAALSALKEQLKQQLAAVEKQEKATEESLRPQTVAEVDDLLKKLGEAVEELKSRRAELEAREKEQQPPQQ